MPLSIDIEDYLSQYQGSDQERDPIWRHNVFRATRVVADQAAAALSRASGGSRAYAMTAGTRIDVRSLREEAENAPVDLKPGLLYGKSSRVSRKGTRYAIVPFRKSTPGRGKGGLYTLPNDVYRASLRGQTISPNSEMGMRFQRVGYGGEPWKSGPFAGLTRYEGEYRGGTRYYTFRTVSENSPPLSWIRPPFLAREEAVSEVRDYMNSVIPEIIVSELGMPTFSVDEF